MLHHGLNLDNLTTIDICVSDRKAVLFSIVLSLPRLNHILPVHRHVFNSWSASKFTELFSVGFSTAFNPNFTIEELLF